MSDGLNSPEVGEIAKKPITFRTATTQDAKLMARIDEAAYSLPEEAPQRFGVDKMKDFIEKHEERGANNSFIAFEGDKPVGHMLLTTKDPQAEKKEFFIASWSIIPESRSVHTMSLMLKHAFEMDEDKTASFEGWTRASTTFGGFLRPGMKKWLSMQGYEAHAVPTKPTYFGGELHLYLRISPLAQPKQ